MTREKPPAATIFTWLKQNGIPLGALTSHSTAALMAAVQIAQLWMRGEYREMSSLAFGQVVRQMGATQFMAYHAIAHVADWHNRSELWDEAGLDPLPENTPECKFAPNHGPGLTENLRAALEKTGRMQAVRE